ncbi:hypothetical protein V1506DRAFT_572398 [Lipomyces tetrasporus]
MNAAYSAPSTFVTPCLGIFHKWFDNGVVPMFDEEGFKKYYPFADNIYKRAKSGPLNQNYVKAEYYECRLFGKASHDKKNRERRLEAARAGNLNVLGRHTPRREERQCPFRLIIRVTCDVNEVPLSYRFEPKGHHSHDLERSDQIKRNEFVRKHSSTEAQKLYRPSEIIKAASETRSLEGRQVLKQIGGNFIRTQEVINLQLKVLTQNPDERAPKRSITAGEDITEAIDFLSTRPDYLVRRLAVNNAHAQIHGFVFSARENIVTLRLRGCLILFDSTYATNAHNYPLFTFMVRDKSRILIPCAHAIVQSEKSDILCKALETLKFATEQKAVKMAFSGLELEAGGERVEHLLCKVHAMRTLKRRLNSGATKRSQRHLISALVSKTTEVGCDNEIDLALLAAPTDHDRQYIQKEWKDRKKMWAAYARQHSARLLQIDTTNGVENFHSLIKKHNSGKSFRQKYSIKGLVAHLLALGERIKEAAKRSAQNFRTQHLKEVDELPQLKRFPLPMQKLIVEELDALRHIGGDEPDRIEEDNVQCDLVFSSGNRTYEILTEDHWNNFVVMFENRGFDVYEGCGQKPAQEKDRDEMGAPARRALTLKETIERLRSCYYELEEGMDPEQRENAINLWLRSLQRASADFLTEEGTTHIVNVERERREAGSEE